MEAFVRATASRNSVVSKAPASSGMVRTTSSLSSPEACTSAGSTCTGESASRSVAWAMAWVKRSTVAEIPSTIGMAGARAVPLIRRWTMVARSWSLFLVVFMPRWASSRMKYRVRPGVATVLAMTS